MSTGSPHAVKPYKGTISSGNETLQENRSYRCKGGENSEKTRDH